MAESDFKKKIFKKDQNLCTQVEELINAYEVQ